MAVRRRPALRVTSPRKKPAANAEELKVDSFTYLLELTAAQLRCLGLVELAYGYYYNGFVKVAGYITGLGRDPDYLEFKLTGTQTERFVEVLSEPSRRIMQLHICPKDYAHAATGADILHASGFWEVGERKLPWHTMFEEVKTAPEEPDELVKLREHYAARSKAVAGEKESPSGEEEKEKKKRKKKKKAKEKEKKADKGKSDKEGSEEEAVVDRGQKGLKSLFGGTCLDPRLEERSKLMRKARKLGKKEGRKRKHSSSDDSSSGSSTFFIREFDIRGGGFSRDRRRSVFREKEGFAVDPALPRMLGGTDDRWNERIAIDK